MNKYNCLFIGGRLHNKIRPVKGNIYVATWTGPAGQNCVQYFIRVDDRALFKLYKPADNLPLEHPQQGPVASKADINRRVFNHIRGKEAGANG